VRERIEQKPNNQKYFTFFADLLIISEDVLLDEELVEDLQLEAGLEDLQEHPLCSTKQRQH
jgi:hypothetical protein